jgi:hypothetical protein
MAYKILLPSKMMKDLWLLREYCAAPPIIQQIRESVAEYLKRKESEIGTSIGDVAGALEKHRQEERISR